MHRRTAGSRHRHVQRQALAIGFDLLVEGLIEFALGRRPLDGANAAALDLQLELVPVHVVPGRNVEAQPHLTVTRQLHAQLERLFRIQKIIGECGGGDLQQARSEQQQAQHATKQRKEIHGDGRIIRSRRTSQRERKLQA